MLLSLIAWSLRYRGLVALGILSVIALGAWSALKLRIDAFPDTTPVQVQVNTVCPGFVAEEIERQVTFPIELSMGGIPGLESMRSISQFGLSVVVLTFRDGTDVYFARQLINERLQGVEIPQGVVRPEMGPVSTGLGEVFHYILIPDGESLTDVKTYQDWTLKPGLRPVPGTAEVNSWGGLNKQYQIRVDPARLQRYKLTFEQLMSAIPKNNLNVGGGSISLGGDAILVHGIGRTTTIEQIGNIVLTSIDGVPVRVRDVGEVTIGHDIRRGLVTANGKGEVVLGLGFMLMGENSYAVTTRLRNRFEELEESLPEGIRAKVVYDRTKLVDKVIATVRTNLMEGAFLVVVILYVLLGNLRAGLIAAMAIPLSMLVGFFGMHQTEIAASLLSLGAIDFGIVVDSSVVVLENILRKLGHAGELRGEARLKAIREATQEVRKPACFGQLIIMIVYIPILTLEGVEGKMFRPMAWTVVFILIGSLVLSLTVTPVLASWFLPRMIQEKEVWLVRLAAWFYRPILRWSMSARYFVVILSALILAATLNKALYLGTEFVPRLSEGDIVLGIFRTPGTSLEASAESNSQIERRLLEEFPDEIENVWSRTGTPEVATDAGAVEATDLFISLKPREAWKRAKYQTELSAQMSKVVEEFPGQIVWFTQPIEQRINEMVSGVRADIALKIFGEDLEELIPKANELQNIIRQVPGAADVAVEQVSGQPLLRVTVKQDEIARYGIHVREVLDVVEAISGKSVGQIVEGQLRFPLVVRLPERLRDGPDAIRTLMLEAPGGERVPLSRVADIELVDGPKLITREWSKRRIVVQCNVRNRDVGSFVAEAQRRIAEEVELPPDRFRLEWGGQFENMKRAQQRLTIVVPLALGMIVALLYLTYRTATDALLLFISVPFACVGGIWSLAFREMPLSISAAVGFITLSGVSVLNGMLLVSALKERLERGGDPIQNLYESCFGCLRTIMTTALVASLGFIPMAFSIGSGAEVQRPLATVVIGGVITSTLFTLFELPVLYRLTMGKSPTPGVDRRESEFMVHEEHPPVPAGSPGA